MRVVLFAILIFLAAGQASAEDFFTSKIEPILKQRCFECHSHQQKMRGGLLEKEYAQEITLVKGTLGELAPRETHWDEYLRAWG